ncbi:MAG: hypothetical protein RL033_6167 [Pseudomonadota bacterium]|jgi:hypothetical protein
MRTATCWSNAMQWCSARSWSSTVVSRSRTLALGGALVASVACAGAAAPPPPPPTVEGAEEAIARIGSFWEARYTDKGLRSSPSPIASFDRQLVSRLELASGQPLATESLSFDERFNLRDAREVRCQGRFDIQVNVGYGMRGSEPALELDWPALSQPRQCDSADVPIPPFERPAGRARFVLRSDQLVGVEPALERRIFLPVD